MTILDTDIVSLLEKRDETVRARAAAAREAGPVTIAIVTRIERLRGRFDAVFKADSAANLLLMQTRLIETEKFLASFVVVPLDSVSGGHFARLSVNKPTRSMGRGDLLIACIALAHNAAVATRNVKDFRQVPGLKLEDWTK